MMTLGTGIWRLAMIEENCFTESMRSRLFGRAHSGSISMDGHALWAVGCAEAERVAGHFP